MSIDPERWRSIDRILDGALDTPPEARARYLDDTCGDDAELRREIETLIDSCEQASGMFEEGPSLVAQEMLGVSNSEWERVAPGTVIGHWRIVRELGRGGMGAVFLAERADGAFEKSAALKLVKRGMDTDEINTRFQAERQILARLEHPNIAGLHDGGVFDDNLPYFVMELAQGPPIDEYCDTHKLTLADRLHMFRTVCEAVQYAHRNLVVHRDLKPGNIAVVDGQVKLLDFGIAKLLATDGTSTVGGITRAYAQRLTPQYAAPEQVLGEATTTATDVYSLGVILYELLCGHPPYQIATNSLRDIERVVCEELPRTPSAMLMRDADTAVEIARHRNVGAEQLVDQLRGDLDAICLRALRKEPSERYDSAASLAEDILRHLTGIPVVARPQTRAYRISKFVQRNKGLVGLAAAAVLALVVGTAATSWQAWVASQERDLREFEAARATASNQWLIGVLATFSPNRLQGQREFTVEELIRVGLESLQSLDGQPNVKASVMNALGQITFDFGDYNRADSLYRAAYEILKERPNDTELAVAMMGIGEVWRWNSTQFDSARVWFERALAIQRSSDEPDDASIAEAEEGLAFSLYNMTDQERSPEENDSLLAASRALRDNVIRRDGVTLSVRAASLEGLADLDLGERIYDRAIARYREAIEIRRQIYGPTNPENGLALMGLSRALERSGSIDDAVASMRESLAILHKVFPEGHQHVAWAHYQLGVYLTRRNAWSDAQIEFITSTREWQRAGLPNHAYAANAWIALGGTRLRLGDAVEAERDALRGIAISEVAEVDEGVVHRAQALLGRSLAHQNRILEAIPILEASREWFATHDPVEADALARMITRLRDEANVPDSGAVSTGLGWWVDSMTHS